jgi:Fe-S-cluster containining protein
LLPLTDDDVRRIAKHTGDLPRDFVSWVDRHGIAMDDEPEAFVMLRQGKRVMVLRHQRGRCRYLGRDNRCTIYAKRPLGCRIFPFDPEFSRRGTLTRLALIQATECPYTLEGNTRVEALRALDNRHTEAQQRYHEKVAEWNRMQKTRRRQRQAARTAKEFLEFLGV